MKKRDYGLMEKVISLAGTSFEQDNVRRFGCEDIGSYELVREPDNPYDRNAISVRLAHWKLGYIPAVDAKFLAPEMDTGKKFNALFSRRKDGVKNGYVGLEIRIR